MISFRTERFLSALLCVHCGFDWDLPRMDAHSYTFMNRVQTPRRLKCFLFRSKEIFLSSFLRNLLYFLNWEGSASSAWQPKTGSAFISHFYSANYHTHLITQVLWVSHTSKSWGPLLSIFQGYTWGTTAFIPFWNSGFPSRLLWSLAEFRFL